MVQCATQQLGQEAQNINTHEFQAKLDNLEGESVQTTPNLQCQICVWFTSIQICSPLAPTSDNSLGSPVFACIIETQASPDGRRRRSAQSELVQCGAVRRRALSRYYGIQLYPESVESNERTRPLQEIYCCGSKVVPAMTVDSIGRFIIFDLGSIRRECWRFSGH